MTTRTVTIASYANDVSHLVLTIYEPSKESIYVKAGPAVLDDNSEVLERAEYLKSTAVSPSVRDIHERLTAQREKMKVKFANRAQTPATADFDLPAGQDINDDHELEVTDNFVKLGALKNLPDYDSYFMVLVEQEHVDGKSKFITCGTVINEIGLKEWIHNIENKPVQKGKSKLVYQVLNVSPVKVNVAAVNVVTLGNS